MWRSGLVLLVLGALGGCVMGVEGAEDVTDEAGCAPSEERCDGVDNDCDGVVDDYELYCCSWSDKYVGRCIDGEVVGCGWCLELDGRPGMGPESWD